MRWWKCKLHLHHREPISVCKEGKTGAYHSAWAANNSGRRLLWPSHAIKWALYITKLQSQIIGLRVGLSVLQIQLVLSIFFGRHEYFTTYLCKAIVAGQLRRMCSRDASAPHQAHQQIFSSWHIYHRDHLWCCWNVWKYFKVNFSKLSNFTKD